MGDYTLSLSANIRALSPVDFNQFNNNQSLFSSPDTSPRNMQDGKTGTSQKAVNSSEESLDKSVDDSLLFKVNADAISSVGEFHKTESIASTTLPDVGIVTSLAASLVGSAPSSSSNNSNLWTATTTPNTATVDDTFFQGFQAVNGGMTFQSFNPTPLFGGQNMPQHVHQPQIGGLAGLNVSSAQSRRPITGQHVSNIHRQQLGQMFQNAGGLKPGLAWNQALHNQHSWSGSHPAGIPQHWGANPIAPTKRHVPNPNISAQFRKQGYHMTPTALSPSKFKRSTSYPGQMQSRAAYDQLTSVDDSTNNFLNIQERSNGYDSMRLGSLETHLLDIMRQTQTDQMESKGKSPFGNLEEHLLDDGSLDQTVPNINSPNRISPNHNGMERMEKYSRKVFVGGLPPDIDEEEITAAFRRFGPLVVDWPHKAESKSYFPPKGYCFLLFQDELSVQALVEACIVDDNKLYWCVSSPTMKDKPVQIRPWSIADSDFVMDGTQPLDPRKTIFVGGVPRPLRAVELAMIMDRLYGGVCYAGIDTDPELKYPKGAGRVAFSNQQSYIAAISARFVQLQHADIDKRVEVKPYVLDDQFCDECNGTRCGGKFAPFFCANVTCLQYFCEQCWAAVHARPGREFHKPLVKEGADRPRAVPFRWC